MSTETVRLIRDGEKGGGEGGMEVGEEGERYTYHYTVPTRMMPALRWAATRAIFNVSLIVRDKVTAGTVSTNHNLFEENGEPKRYRTVVLPITSLTPYR